MKQFIVRENLKFTDFKNKRVVLTIGTFDAIHIGHQKIINTVIKEAEKEGFVPTVLTFKNNPATVVNSQEIKEINSPDIRKEIFNLYGIELLIMLKFTKNISKMSYKDFLNTICSLFIVKKFITGEDFRFGAGREGDIKKLKNYAKSINAEVIVVKSVKREKRKVSSSLIRELVQKGEVQKASMLLNRYFLIDGKVVKGLGKGQEIGYPTVNINPLDPFQILPGDGIYFTFTKVINRLYPSVTYIGYDPFKGKYTFETHILFFSGEIVNEKLRTYFIKKLREPVVYKNERELKKGLQKDVEKARKEYTRGEIIKEYFI